MSKIVTEIDCYLMPFAVEAAKSSHDLHTKVGAVIAVGYFLVSKGANRFPLGVELSPERLGRPVKHSWILHAETIAIHNAYRFGKRGINNLSDATIYSTHPPCASCMGNIIMSGIRRVVAPNRMTLASIVHKDWNSEMWVAEQMAKEAGVVMVEWE